jgi:hypothetical protein
VECAAHSSHVSARKGTLATHANSALKASAWLQKLVSLSLSLRCQLVSHLMMRAR